MRFLLGTLLAAVVAAPLAAAPGDAQQPLDAVTANLCAGGPIPASALAGGIHAACSLAGRVVTADGASVVVPPPGLSVGADGYGGVDHGLVVSNRGGVVTASLPADRSGGGSDSGAAAQTAPAGPCHATAYKLENGKHPWATRMTWHLRSGSVPGRLGKRATRTQLVRALHNWKSDNNTCGITGRPRIRTAYAGSTGVASGIRAGGSSVRCGAYNHTNTVELGRLPGRLLGWTCFWWGSNNKMVAFDTRLTRDADVVIDPGRACRNNYDLQSIATHEFGHALGLGHVSNPSLTMHHYAPHCSKAPRTLGRGDVRGLRALYGLTRG